MVNKIVRIISDNENYINYTGIDLVITERYLQEGRDEEPIINLNIVDSGELFPFSLYEWEFEEV